MCVLERERERERDRGIDCEMDLKCIVLTI